MEHKNYFETENLESIADLLSDEFVHYRKVQDDSYEINKEYFLNEYKDNHFVNNKVVNFEISNRVTNVKPSTKVVIIGEGTEIYKEPDFSNENTVEH